MSSPARSLVEDRLEQLATEVDELFARTIAETIAQTRECAQREYGERLNQAARRLRIAGGLDELCATLADAAAPLAAGAMVFRLADGIARHERIEIPLADAPAMAGAVESHEPQTSMATGAEVSQPLVDLVGHSASERASIFPVDSAGDVKALVYTWGPVQVAALELLAQVAGAAWGSLEALEAPPPPEPAPPPPPELVTIAPAAPVPEPTPAPAVAKPTWETLPPEEQQIHLRAQRYARVQVAEMRLFEGDLVQVGRLRRDLYTLLRKPIDSARAAFREQFFKPCASMVDYLHLELVRTLGNDDPDLLGKDYPGPLV